MLASQPSGASHERIGRYEVLRKIATGGMAELFLAKQVGMEGFERVVALKRILAHLAYDEEFINMFRDEARIVAKLSHPNIVQIFDLGKAEDTYFIAMEYIPGRNLSSVAKKARAKGEKLPPANIARCVAQACEGLHYAHTRSDLNGKPLEIVHRDVSPQNIIVAFSGTVKLVDFGIAKAATKIAHTRAGVLKGKYAYMSPEQIRGEVVDARSDLFAVGIVLYELLCGRRPFEKENSIQTLKAIVQEPHRDCRELNSDIPDGLAEIIDRALTKDRDERFADAQELQLALEDFVSGSGQRVNNLSIANWITKLFEEELSREQGGTVVFQGIGEVILPDVDEERDSEESPVALPAPSDAEGTHPPDGPAGGSNEDVSRPLPLTRGRGGGSIGERPPIPAPSTAMGLDGQRESLIEEGVIDRPVARRDGYDDDATVLGTGASAVPPRRSTDVPRYSDDATEFTSGGRGGSEAGDPSPREADVTGPASPLASDTSDLRPPGRARTGAPQPQGTEPESGVHAGSEDHTLVPEDLAARAAEVAPEASSAGLLQPLSQVVEEDFEATDDPWDEATVGFPDGTPPDMLPADEPEAVAEEDWGELSDGDFEADATLAGLPEAWDDPTAAAGRALSSPSGVRAPLVQEPLDYEDSEPLEIDLGDPEADDPGEELPDATITQPGLGEEFGGDATIAVPSISDEIIERHASQFGRFDDSATIGAAPGVEEVEDADVEPLDFAEVGDELPAPASDWGGDATLAGAPLGAMPDVAGLDPDEDFDVELSSPDLEDAPPGLEVEIDHTVRAMDEEPELPVPRSDRDVDQDARTVAGSASDYLVAGVRPDAGVTYEPEEQGTMPAEDADYLMPGAKGRRGQEQLGAIQLNRVAVARGLGSEERTEGEVPAYSPSPEPYSEAFGESQTADGFDSEIGELPGAQEDFQFELGIDEDAPPVEPSPLDEPSSASEPELPAALPGPTAAQARDAYSALLAPKLPAPINPSHQGSNQGDNPPAAMPIGSTNVPPANLSLSQMLEHPSHASRSKLMAMPRATSTAGRSASIVGRQIREVARSTPPAGVEALPPPAHATSGVMPPPAPRGASGADQPPLPGLGGPELLEPPPPPTRGSRRWALPVLLVLLVGLFGVLAYFAYPVFLEEGGFHLLGPSGPRLTINTNPPGARVYIDDALQSELTPLTIKGLEPGTTYTVRVVRDGYEAVSQPVQLPAKKTLTWRIPLEKTRAPAAAE